MPTMEIRVEFNFSSAHRLPFYDGPCFRMHGHNYQLFVTASGVPDPHNGMVVDFEIVKKIVWDRVLAKCDHQTINDFMENPTAENMIVWMWEELRGHVPGLRTLELFETPEYCVTYRGEGHGT